MHAEKPMDKDVIDKKGLSSRNAEKTPGRSGGQCLYVNIQEPEGAAGRNDSSRDGNMWGKEGCLV